MSIHIGTSGWSYNHWEDIVYPKGTPPRNRLKFYLERFQTVEVNATYYRWPLSATFTGWRQRLPNGFVMTVKAPRSLTHILRLASPERWLDRMTGDLARLGDRLGVLLVQLSPRFPINPERLRHFLGQLPPGLKTAFEFRHPSWHEEEISRCWLSTKPPTAS